jgi:hypothetical protein
MRAWVGHHLSRAAMRSRSNLTSTAFNFGSALRFVGFLSGLGCLGKLFPGSVNAMWRTTASARLQRAARGVEKERNSGPT